MTEAYTSVIVFPIVAQISPHAALLDLSLWHVYGRARLGGGACFNSCALLPALYTLNNFDWLVADQAQEFIFGVVCLKCLFSVYSCFHGWSGFVYTIF